MTKYRGLYVDHVVFSSHKEIDDFLREQAVKAYKEAVELFCDLRTMEASVYASEHADKLHYEHGLSWNEIEDIEEEVMASCLI